MSSDTELVCGACGGTFTFSASEQAYYQERGFQPPKRCRTCRQSGRRQERPARGAGGGPRPGAGPRPGPRSVGGARLGAGPRPGPARPGSRRGAVSGLRQEGPKRPYPVTCRDCGAAMGVPFPPRETAIRCASCFAAVYGE